MAGHLLGAMGMNEWELRLLLDRAAEPSGASLAGRLVVLGATEASPSTPSSAHEVAARRLGADAVRMTLEGDVPTMARALAALAPDLAVLSHGAAGVPSRIAARLRCPVVNAGDGARENLPDALVITLALREALGDVQGRSVVLLGDALHSGTARSALIVLGALGARLRLVAPSTLLPPGAAEMGATIHTDADEGVLGADALVVLPLAPRAVGTLVASARDFERDYGATPERIARAAPGAVVVDRAARLPHDVPVMMALMLTALGVEP